MLKILFVLRTGNVLFLQIRNKILKVKNDSRSVRLAFEATSIEKDLLWCFAEIHNDIATGGKTQQFQRKN